MGSEKGRKYFFIEATCHFMSKTSHGVTICVMHVMHDSRPWCDRNIFVIFFYLYTFIIMCNIYERVIIV